MKLLDEALKPVQKHFEEAGPVTKVNKPFVSNSENNRRWRSSQLTKNETSVSLRLDWAFAEEILEDDATWPQILGLLFIQAENDLRDLIENGDFEHKEDPLLKTFDGSKKRGKEPVEIEILAAHLFAQYKKSNKMWEYTMYIRPYVRWE